MNTQRLVMTFGAQSTPLRSLKELISVTNAHSPWHGRHQQTLLATNFNGQPLTVDHGAHSVC